MVMVRKDSPEKARLEKALQDLPGIVAKVGWFESAKYDDAAQTPVAYVAAIQNAGVASRGIPARPFMEPTIDRETPAWTRLVEGGVRAVLKGNATVDMVMEGLALQAAADVSRTISDIVDPPLSILTLLARKHKLAGGQVTGATIGRFAKQVKAAKKNGEEVDVSGVSTKPLNETGLMMATLIGVTEKK